MKQWISKIISIVIISGLLLLIYETRGFYYGLPLFILIIFLIIIGLLAHIIFPKKIKFKYPIFFIIVLIILYNLFYRKCNIYPVFGIGDFIKCRCLGIVVKERSTIIDAAYEDRCLGIITHQYKEDRSLNYFEEKAIPLIPPKLNK